MLVACKIFEPVEKLLQKCVSWPWWHVDGQEAGLKADPGPGTGPGKHDEDTDNLQSFRHRLVINIWRLGRWLGSQFPCPLNFQDSALWKEAPLSLQLPTGRCDNSVYYCTVCTVLYCTVLYYRLPSVHKRRGSLWLIQGTMIQCVTTCQPGAAWKIFG